MRVHQTDFSKGNVYRNIIEVSLPMTLAQLLNLLYNIVDRSISEEFREQVRLH